MTLTHRKPESEDPEAHALTGIQSMLLGPWAKGRCYFGVMCSGLTGGFKQR